MPSLRSLLPALAVLTAGAAAAAPAAPASAALTGGFGARPAPLPGERGAQRPYFRLELAGGARRTRDVIVTNASAAPVRLRVSAVDGLTAVTTGAVYGNRQDRVLEAGQWVTPSARIVALAPHTARRLAFRVAVPPHARPGDHLAGIAFEDLHHRRSTGRFAVTQVIRVVVGVQIRVPGPAAARLELGATRIQALGGTQVPAVAVGLHNRGRLLCHPRLSVRLAGGGGARTVARALDTVLPGDAITYPLAWPRALRAGTYDAQLRATGCGPAATRRAVLHVARALTGTATRPELAPVAPTAAARPATAPWPLFLLVGIAGVGLGVAAGRLRRSS